MKQHEWQTVLSQCPPGLSSSAVARQVGKPPQQTRYWLKKLNYQGVDGRKFPNPHQFDNRRKCIVSEMDWTIMNNAELARKHGISRERVRQLRKKVVNSC